MSSVRRGSEQKPHFCKFKLTSKHCQIWRGFDKPFCVSVQVCLTSLKKSGKIINGILRCYSIYDRHEVRKNLSMLKGKTASATTHYKLSVHAGIADKNSHLISWQCACSVLCQFPSPASQTAGVPVTSHL